MDKKTLLGLQEIGMSALAGLFRIYAETLGWMLIQPLAYMTDKHMNLPGTRQGNFDLTFFWKSTKKEAKI